MVVCVKVVVVWALTFGMLWDTNKDNVEPAISSINAIAKNAFFS